MDSAPPPFEPRPSEGINHPNVVAMLAARMRRSSTATALRHRSAGSWRALTWLQWWERSRALAASLVETLGIRQGDRVGLMSSTRLEWVLWDAAIAMAGAISVPVYPSISREEVRHILRDAGVRVLVAEHPEHVRRIAGGSAPNELADEGEIPVVDAVVLLDGEVDLPRARGGGRLTLTAARASLDASWAEVGFHAASELERAGDRTLRTPGNLVAATLDRMERDLRPDDVFTLVYTSGTTGRPKGAVIHHRNVVYEAWAIKATMAVDASDSQLVVLPLAQIFARHMIWAGVESGTVAAFARSLEAVGDGLREVAPTFMGGVPRIFEKIQARIVAEASAAGPVQSRTFEWAVSVGKRISASAQRGLPPSLRLMAEHALADRLVLAPIRARFGGRLRFFIAGGAPLARDTAEFFHALGIVILEGYGLTETTGATNVNRPDLWRFGTVGPALPGCEIVIAEDGEILARGLNVMSGYWKAPEATAEVVDADGWLHTGDIGEIVDGFLRITDRKKDLIITAGGKNIAPQKIESRLMARTGIGQAMVLGDRRPFLVALITLDEAAMMATSDREGLGCRNYADLVRHPRIRRLVQDAVDKVNADLASYETVKKFAIPPADFSEAGGELTPTLKVRRRIVAAKYSDLVDSLFEETTGSR